MDRIEWCLRIAKGLELIEPNINLSKVYFLKAENALKAARRLRGIPEWEITASYYAIYFGVYAIMMRMGVKCENHSCTIAFCERFLSMHLSKDEINLLGSACKARIDAQYYSDKPVEERLRESLLKKAPLFIEQCKEAYASLKEKEIVRIRTLLDGRSQG
ncbi:MAG: HEPN domain-containing protein [archaeon]